MQRYEYNLYGCIKINSAERISRNNWKCLEVSHLNILIRIIQTSMCASQIFCCYFSRNLRMKHSLAEKFSFKIAYGKRVKVELFLHNFCEDAKLDTLFFNIYVYTLGFIDFFSFMSIYFEVDMFYFYFMHLY